MSIDEILKEHAAWLEAATTKSFFDRVTEREAAFPEELRNKRTAELTATIEALIRRRDEMTARYDQAIDGFKRELELQRGGIESLGLGPSAPDTPPIRRQRGKRER